MGQAPERFSFDDQAGDFERRTGIPDGVSRRVALDMTGSLLRGSSDLLVDMGAGSGELGRHLALHAPRYLAIDRSMPMLGRFRERAPAISIGMVQADADAAWPLSPGSVRAMLFSRSAHLLDPTHLLRELQRVASPSGAWVVIGRVERDAGSMRSILREQMLRLLEEHPRSARPGGGQSGDSADRTRSGGQRILRALAEWGAQVQPARPGGSWVVQDSLPGVLDDWRSKSGLAGRDLDPGVKREVLSALEAWAVERFGTLEGRVEDCERRFEWTPVRLPLTQSPPY